MFRFLVATIFVAYTLLQLADSAVLQSSQNAIHQGRCAGDRLINEDIIKPASPHTTKKLTYKWRGNNAYYITCINVSNKLNRGDAGTVRILEGGVDKSELALEMVSQNGKGIGFHLDMYGELRIR